jgi:uncharacterized RDD family membrane protein YckC
VAEVVTGEAVVLEVPCARFPSRLAALAIDLLIQFVLLLILFAIVGAGAAGSGLDAALTGALVLSVLVLVVVGYPVTWETLTRGRSPGKFALGLRVVGDDGSPERFRQALVRGLVATVEIWALLGFPALACSLLSARGKRLGDMFAGTFVLQQRLPARRTPAAVLVVPPGLAPWAATLQLSALTEQTAETARRYLSRMAELTPVAREELAQRIAATVQAQVSPPPPPGTPAPVFLAAVLAERRNREQARLLGAQRPGAGPGHPPGGTPTHSHNAPGQPASTPSQPYSTPTQPYSTPIQPHSTPTQRPGGQNTGGFAPPA